MGTTDALVKFRPSKLVTVGTISGTTVLDGLNVADFGNGVLEYVKGKPGLHLLLNFEHITYMSSAGLTELLRINEALQASRGSIRLCNLSCDIRKVFKITNLDQMFAIHEDENLGSAVQRYERSLTVAANEDAWAGQDTGA